jgi:hypothetical protein
MNPVFHAVLRKLSHWVFPPVKAPVMLKVFRALNAPLSTTKVGFDADANVCPACLPPHLH